MFWHSSAHIMGEAMERHYGGHLCYGPPIEEGYYYDMFCDGRLILIEQLYLVTFMLVTFYVEYIYCLTLLNYQRVGLLSSSQTERVPDSGGGRKLERKARLR